MSNSAKQVLGQCGCKGSLKWCQVPGISNLLRFVITRTAYKILLLRNTKRTHTNRLHASSLSFICNNLSSHWKTSTPATLTKRRPICACIANRFACNSVVKTCNKKKIASTYYLMTFASTLKPSTIFTSDCIDRSRKFPRSLSWKAFFFGSFTDLLCTHFTVWAEAHNPSISFRPSKTKL